MQDIGSYEAYCFDLDGTVYLGNQLIEGVRETIAELRRRGKKILFLTNSSIHTRRDCIRRLETMALPCREEEVLTALHMSGEYFRRYVPDACVFLVGERVMRRQMEESGVGVTDDPGAATHVLVGMDRGLTYEKLRQGMQAARAGARLVAVNPDPACPVQGGWIPDTWSIVKALETAAGVPTELYIGKPSRYYAEQALRQLSLMPEQILMIGDRLETDIAMGINSGMATALVLTGVATEADIDAGDIRPHYVLPSLADLFSGSTRRLSRRESITKKG